MRGDLLPLSRTCYGVRYPTRGELRKPFRGCRAGAKLRLGGGDTSLFILMGNVNSLSNKCDKLLALARSRRLCRESCLMCFTAMWMNDNAPDPWVDAKLVNNRWFHYRHVTVKILCQDIKRLVLSFKSYYVPKEFSHYCLHPAVGSSGSGV